MKFSKDILLVFLVPLYFAFLLIFVDGKYVMQGQQDCSNLCVIDSSINPPCADMKAVEISDYLMSATLLLMFLSVFLPIFLLWRSREQKKFTLLK